MDVNDFFRELEEYYGGYRKEAQKSITEAFVRKRIQEGDLKILLRYTYENHHPNHGPPTVSTFKKVLESARKEDHFSFLRPREADRGKPLRKCEKCGKVFAIEGTSCPWCSTPVIGSGMIVVPKGYFD